MKTALVSNTTEQTSYPIRLFEPVPVVRRELVRYQGLNQGYRCVSGWGGQRHEARVSLGDVDQPVDSGRRIWTPEQAGIPKDDPRWPVHCQGGACPTAGGYAFAAEDPQYVYGTRLFQEVTLAGDSVREPVLGVALPIGALYRARSDGMYLPFERAESGSLLIEGDFMCVTPDGFWWLSEETPDRAGSTYRLAIAPGDFPGALTLATIGAPTLASVHLGGPAARWAIDSNELVLNPSAGRPS